MRALALLGMAAVLCSPYFPVLRAPLMDPDTAIWVGDARIKGLWELVRGPHFIGFRPLTALTYLLGAAPGQEEIVHAFDLLLWMALLCGVFLFARSTLRLSALPSLAFTTFLGFHPIGEEILPYASRRGDVLVALLSLGYLATLCSSLRSRGVATAATVRAGDRPTSFASSTIVRGMVLFMALMSKESAFLLVPCACVSLFLHQQGGIVRRLGSVVRHLWVDVAIVSMASILHWIALREGSGYLKLPDLKDKLLIPVDYALASLFPHAFGAAVLGRFLLLSTIAAFGIVLLTVTLRRWSFLETMLSLVLLLEAALYALTTPFQSRMVLLGVTCFVLLCAAVAARTVSLRHLIAALVIPVLWTALQLASNPWSRVADLAGINSDYVTALRAAIEKRPAEEKLRILAGDFPRVWNAHPLAVRAGIRQLQSDPLDPSQKIVSEPEMRRMLEVALPGRTLSLIPLVGLRLERMSQRWTVDLRRTDTGELSLAFDLPEEDLILPGIILASTVEDVAAHRQRLDLSIPFKNTSTLRLFLLGRPEPELLEVPDHLLIETREKSSDHR